MTEARTPHRNERRFRRMCCQGQSWTVALLTAFLFALPTIRTNESSELDTAKERVEDVSLVVRSVSVKRLTLHGRQERVVFTASHPFMLGRAQRVSPTPPAGHRLPNGLMAPMIC